MAITETLNELPASTTAYNMPDFATSEVDLVQQGQEPNGEYYAEYSIDGGDGDAVIRIHTRDVASSAAYPQGRRIMGVTLTLSNVVEEDGVVIRREPIVAYVTIHDGSLSGLSTLDLAKIAGSVVQPLLGSAAPPATDGGMFGKLRRNVTSIID